VPEGDGPGLRELKKLQTWRTIQEAAIRLITERGYEAVSADDIAAAANVSRSTFFNYFATKEATVFDPDPREAEGWRDLMRARPADEPLWASLQEILLGYLRLHGNRMAIQKRLKAASPTLGASMRDSGDRFRAELRAWVASRTPPGHEQRSTLLLNSAIAVMVTADTLWSPDDGPERYLRLASECFAQVSHGFAEADHP
jgi:AcrR family transcriptional regulator